MGIMCIHDPMANEEEAAHRRAREAFGTAVRERDDLPQYCPGTRIRGGGQQQDVAGRLPRPARRQRAVAARHV